MSADRMFRGVDGIGQSTQDPLGSPEALSRSVRVSPLALIPIVGGPLAAIFLGTQVVNFDRDGGFVDADWLWSVPVGIGVFFIVMLLLVRGKRRLQMSQQY